MSDLLTGIIIGMFVGVALGVLIMSLMAMAKRADSRQVGEYKQPYNPVYYDSWWDAAEVAIMRLEMKTRKSKAVERLWFKLAWFIPRKLVYFAVIRLWANATQGQWSHVAAPDVTVSEAIERWQVIE